MVRTFIVEEHNEAFLVWSRAISAGLIPATGNELVHVDQHSDLDAPRLKRSVKDTMDDDELLEFVFRDLRIGTFIIPAVYLGLFNSIQWVKKRHNLETQKTLFVRSYNTSGKKLIIQDELPLGIDLTDDDVQSFQLIRQNVENLECTNDAVLDIDLDYFSAEENPAERTDCVAEITREEYWSFHNDRYHQINYLGPIVEAVEKNGRYFYTFNMFDEIYPSRLAVDDGIIQQRVEELIEVLSRIELVPKLITICRSVKSGHTPSSQGQLIETMVLKGLRALYEIDPQMVDDSLA